MKNVQLPHDELERKRQAWREVLHKSDREEAEVAYATLLDSISHPDAIALGRVVKGTKYLQYLLNVVLILRRLTWIAALLLIYLTWCKSWWYVITLPCLFWLHYVVINAVQVRINIELAARLKTLEELMDSDPDFRQRVMLIIEPGAWDE
ncbi:MAG: hypothetical protein KAT58_05115 [candidate division Zixibacteria bacterium]|nr:hypothetical protein [candidate division Zixibacteria bacterium]